MMSRQDVEPEVEVVGQQADVEGRVVLGREGVHVAADRVDRLGDRGAPTGSACP